MEHIVIHVLGATLTASMMATAAWTTLALIGLAAINFWPALTTLLTGRRPWFLYLQLIRVPSDTRRKRPGTNLAPR